MYRYFESFFNSDYVLEWKSTGLSDESIKSPSVPSNFLTQSLDYYGGETRVRFSGSCLKQEKITYTHGKIVNTYIVSELNESYSIIRPTLVNCLFGAVSLTKHVDIDKYKYSGYRIGLYRGGGFSFGNGFGRNLTIFGVDVSSSTKIGNKKIRKKL